MHCEKGSVCVRRLSLRMSQQMKKLAEKSHLLVVTLTGVIALRAL